MGLTNSGRDFITKAIINDTPTFFNNTNTRIGVGNGSTEFAVSQTDLIGANKLRKGMDVGYPQRSDNEITFKSTFGTDDANFKWSEWGIFNAASSGDMLSRTVEDLGTKNGGNWVLTVTLIINNTQ